jgi:hypothetical protein
MTDSRDEKLNKILSLLSEVSGEKSLDFMARMPKPELVQEAYRKLWRLYSEPKMVSLLNFKLGHIAKKNRRCNTWVADENITERKDIICSVCNKKSDLFIQIDTSDMFFSEKEERKIFHIYTCEDGHEFNVLRSEEDRELSPKEIKTTYTIKSFECAQDKPEMELNILIPDRSKCVDCPADLIDTPFKIKPLTLKTLPRSKCNGYSTHKYFTPHDNIHQGKAKIFKEGILVQLLPTVGCTCFKVDNISTANNRELLYLSSVELPAFDKKSISEIRLFECEECKSLNIVVYSQKMDLPYSNVILEVEDCFYHILRSEDKLNGIVISAKKREHEIKAICFLDNFEYREGYKKCIKYKKVEVLLPIHYTMCEDLHIASGDNCTKFKKFIRNYEGNPEGKEEEEETLNVIKDEKVILRFGEHFNRIGKGTLLEDCILYHKDEEVIIYGNLPVKYTGKEKVKPLSSEQVRCATDMDITIGEIADLDR